MVESRFWSKSKAIFPTTFPVGLGCFPVGLVLIEMAEPGREGLGNQLPPCMFWSIHDLSMIHWPIYIYIIVYNYSYIDIVCINYNVYNNSYMYRLITCMNTYQLEISRSTREPLWVHHGIATQLTAEYWLEILTVGIDRVAYWKWIPNTFERLVDGLASFLIRLWDPDGPHVWSRFVTTKHMRIGMFDTVYTSVNRGVLEV